MMKKLVFILFLVIPFLGISQDIDRNKALVGLSLMYSEDGGLKVGADLEYPMNKYLYLNTRFNISASSFIKDSNSPSYLQRATSSAVAFGLGLKLPVNKRLDFTFGALYQYRKFNNRSIYFLRRDQKNIIFPLELTYHISKKYAIKTGITPKLNINSIRRVSKFCADPHMTFLYKF